jgi:hypothetical protein
MLEKISTVLGIVVKSLCAVLIVFIILESASVIDVFEDTKFVCEHATVTEIISAEYRDVTVQLDNGQTKVINQPQPAIKVGSKVATTCQNIPVSQIVQ